MSKEFNAIDDIKKLAKFVNGLVEFAGELESVASIKQASNEAKSALEKAKAELASVSATHEKLSDACKAADAEVKGLEAFKAKLSKELAEQSKAEKKKILDAANEAASAKIKEANDNALLVMKSVEDETAKLQALKLEVKVQEEALAAVKAAIANLKASLS